MIALQSECNPPPTTKSGILERACSRRDALFEIVAAYMCSVFHPR